MVTIKICPTCGRKKIKKVRRNWTGLYKGHAYTVPNLQFYECSFCGEKIYDPKAMQKIESHSPAFVKAGTRKGRSSQRSTTEADRAMQKLMQNAHP